MSGLIDLMKRVQDAIGRRDAAAVAALVTPDIEYHYHVGSKPLVGTTRLLRFLEAYWARMQDPVWRIDTFAESGSFLLMEGVEEATDTLAGKRIVHPYMGIIETRGGQISRWREYFQMDPAVVAANEANGLAAPQGPKEKP
jgi:ketosteroid isomerase-like protein